MSFPWPVSDAELVLNDALAIAMRYFDLPHDENEYADVECFAAEAIMDHWRKGVRDKTILANKAIAELEERHPIGDRLRPAS
jgi:hypothetical protein